MRPYAVTITMPARNSYHLRTLLLPRPHQPAEPPILAPQQLIWRPNLNHPARIKDDNHVTTPDGLQPMRNSQNRAPPEILSQNPLYDRVRLGIDIARRLVEQQHPPPIPLEQCSRQGKQLLLPERELRPAAAHLGVQAAPVGERGPEPHAGEDGDEGAVRVGGVGAGGVEVEPEGAD